MSDDHNVKQLQIAATFLRKHSCISLREIEHKHFPFVVSELLNSNAREHILQLQSLQLGNPEAVVVGTLFAKRYSVFCMGLIGALSLFDLRLAYSSERIRFRIINEGAMHYETELSDQDLLTTVDIREREAAVSAYAEGLQSHLNKLFHSISAHTGASERVMWSLISNNILNMYDRIENDKAIWQTTDRLELIQHDRAILFAPQSSNKFSLKLRRFDHPAYHGQPFYLRKYCCLAYKVNQNGIEHEYCNTCPKLSSEERLKQL